MKIGQPFYGIQHQIAQTYYESHHLDDPSLDFRATLLHANIILPHKDG